MIHLCWDASSLSKRYAFELGRESVNTLFALVPASQMATTVLGYAETHAVLVRKRNQGDLSHAAFRIAATALETDVIGDVNFGVLGVEFDAIIESIALIARHNINASDAAILLTFLRYAKFLTASGDRCFLIASDKRLLRAAQAEGLETLNPQTTPAADIPALLV